MPHEFLKPKPESEEENPEDIFVQARKYGERVSEAVPRIKSAASLHELWDAVDSVKGWSKEIETTKGTKDQLEDPRVDEERMKVWLANAARTSGASNSPFLGAADQLARAIREKLEALEGVSKI